MESLSSTSGSVPQCPQTAVVHEAYDMSYPPKHPGLGWTRFICISDTHSMRFHVPDGDVLLHAGDLTRHGTLKDLEGTLDWLKELPHPTKFIMAGNHDLCLDANYEQGGLLRGFKPTYLKDKDLPAARKLVRSTTMRRAGLYYLEHESATYKTKSGRVYNIYASPAAPFYSIGAFQYEQGGAKEMYDRIPPGTNILMTHTPPRGTGDVTKRGEHAGCPALTERLSRDDLQSCRLHVYGHIHEAHGATLVGQTQRNPGGRISINAALPSFPLPVIVDLKD